MTPGATRPLLLVHGGAGWFERERVPEAWESQVRAGLVAALAAGASRLGSGGSAVDAVEAAVRELEDREPFNAGFGAALTAEGRVELDAAVAAGADRRAGAVVAARRIRNPVSAARAVMEQGVHVLLAGPGADAFARERGMALVAEGDLVTPHRRAQLDRVRTAAGAPSAGEGEAGGTVGAVALDDRGHLAAATSTGGTPNQAPGRVGDSALFGAGTWADDETCAVSATGDGEAFVRAAFAHDVYARMRYRGHSLASACEGALREVARLGGRGGCIALDPEGRAVLLFTTARMPRGRATPGEAPRVAIHAGEALGGPLAV